MSENPNDDPNTSTNSPVVTGEESSGNNPASDTSTQESIGEAPKTDKTDVQTKVDDFISYIKNQQSESKNSELQEIIDEINLLVKASNLSDTKKEYLFDKVSRLQELDENLITIIASIRTDIPSHLRDASVKPLLDLKYELFKLQVNSLRLLLQKLNLNSGGLQEKFKDLIDITRQKIQIANEIMSADFDDSKDSVQLTKAIDKVLGDKTGTPVDSFIRQVKTDQRGGEDLKQPDLNKFISKFTSLYDLFKSDSMIKLVFLAGYFSDLKDNNNNDKKIKDYIKGIFDFYFIDETQEIKQFLTELASFIGVDYEQFMTNTNITYNSIYNTIQQGGTQGGTQSGNQPENQPENQPGQQIGNPSEPQTSVPTNTNRKLFIPTVCGMILKARESSFEFLSSKQEELTIFYTSVVSKFTEFYKFNEQEKIFEKLKKDKVTINQRYKQIIDDKKVVFTYIKERQDKDENHRFKLKNTDDKALGNIVELEYREYNEELKEGDTIPVTTPEKFYLGPFDNFFRNTDNQDVAKEINGKIKEKLLNGESYCIIGYGQSGSGKTSTLIQLKYTQKSDGKEVTKDGVLLELLKDKDIADNYNVKISGTDIRTTYEANKTGDSRYDLQNIDEQSYSYDKDNQTWSNLKDQNAQTLPDYIKAKIDKGRPIYPTPNNIKSSRSHMIIKVEGNLKPQRGGTTQSGSPRVSAPVLRKPFNLFVCDLAGFENEFTCGSGVEIERFFDAYKKRVNDDPEELFDKNKCKLFLQTYKNENLITEISTKIDAFNEANRQKKVSIDYGKLSIDPEITTQSDKNICDFLQFKVINNGKNEEFYSGNYTFHYKDTHNYEYENSNWKQKVNNVTGGSDYKPEVVIKMVSFLQKMNSVMTDEVKRSMIKFLGTKDRNSLTLDSIPNLLTSKYGKYSTLSSEISQLEEKSTVVLQKKAKKASQTAIGKVDNENENKMTLKKEESVSSLNSKSNNIKDKMNEFLKLINSDKILDDILQIQTVETRDRSNTNNITFTSKWEIFDSEIKDKLSDLQNSINSVNEALKEFSSDFRLGGSLGEFIRNVAMKETTVDFKIFGSKVSSKAEDYYNINALNQEQINNSTKAEDEPEKILIEDIILRVMSENCKLRVIEGKMINDSLIEMKEQIKNMIIDSAGIPETSIYWDTLYHPYCYNLNIRSNNVFIKPERSDVNSSIIVKELLKLAGVPEGGQPKMKFIVFTVLLTNKDTNNPPNPPYFNLNRAKTYESNKQNNLLLGEMIRTINKAKKHSFYENNEFVKKDVNGLQVSDYKKFIETFDRNNSATLIGTLEVTEELQKLNMVSLCQETSDKTRLLDLISDTFGFLTIRGDNKYKMKYLIQN